MGLLATPNQPIQFDVTPSACAVHQYPYVQIVDNNDITQVQFKITPCLTAENVVLDGSFSGTANWVVTDSFSIDNQTNQACKAIGGIGTLTQYNCFVTGVYYQLRIVVAEINEIMQVWNGAQQLGVVSGVGEYVFSFLANGDSVSIRSFSTTNNACISSVSAYELDSRLIVAILNESGVYQTSIKLANNPEYFTFAKDTVTVNVDWATLGISNGCYYIGIADPCINTILQNGLPDPNMRYIDLWSFTPGAWDTPEVGKGFQESGQTGIGSTTTTDLNTLTYTPTVYNTPSDIADYDYTITVYSSSVQTTFEVFIGGVGSGTHSVGVAATVETFTGTISAGPGSPAVYLEIVSGNDSATYNAGVIHFDIELSNPSSDFVSDSDSVNLKLGTFDCSVLLNSNSNEDALGFEFEQSLFNPRVRLEGELINPTYPTERTVIKDTRGNFNTVYGERSKAYLLKIDLQPEYMLDYLSLLPIFDNVWIDGVKYHVSDDQTEIDYPDALVSTGQMAIVVVKQGSQLTNRNTTGNENNTHVLDNNFIVNPLLDDEVITEPDDADTLQAI